MITPVIATQWSNESWFLFFIHRRLNRKYTFHDTEIFVNKLEHYGIWSEIFEK